MMYICGKGKDEYLTGEITIPEKDDPKFRSWKAENHVVMSWLINYMNNDIGENFLLYGTAKEIWDAAREMYSSLENTAELFEIEANLHDLRQGELSVTQYFNNLARLWQQLDIFEVHNWKCSEDTALYRKIMEQKRTFKFLLGFNKNLDEVRGRVMGIKPLPSPREAFSEVRREESRKKVMMGSQSAIPTLEGSALIARGQQSNTTSDVRQRKGRPWCDHCRKPGHLRENCWKIHGKPVDWKPSRPPNDRESRGNIAATTDNSKPSPETSPFTKEQLETLQKMFGQPPVNHNNFGTGSVAQKGNFPNALSVNKQHSRPWIIDSGASDHMTGNANLFHEYQPCKDNYTVRIAEGSLSKVEGTGSIIISKDLTLNSILHVPTLDCNLLSISKLTCDLNCMTKFFPNLFEFQELDSGKMIGSAEMRCGLYLLKDQTPSGRQAQNANCVSVKSQSISNSYFNKDGEIMSWHFRFGHPIFMYLEKPFPSMFINKSCKFFNCEICQLAKHTRTNSPGLPYKPSHPFSMIHSDVWGPSRKKNITGARWFVSFVDDHTRLT